MTQNQSNFGSVFFLIATVFFLLLQAVHCEPYKVLNDCSKKDVTGVDENGQGVAFLGLVKYPGSTGTRFEFFTGGFQRNGYVCLYADNNPILGEFYNNVWTFQDSLGLYSLRIGNTNNGVFLYYSWDNYNFSCDASASAEILPQVTFNYGGKNEAVSPIRYTCKANNGLEKKKRSIVEKMQSRARAIALDQAVA